MTPLAAALLLPDIFAMGEGRAVSSPILMSSSLLEISAFGSAVTSIDGTDMLVSQVQVDGIGTAQIALVVFDLLVWTAPIGFNDAPGTPIDVQVIVVDRPLSPTLALDRHPGSVVSVRDRSPSVIYLDLPGAPRTPVIVLDRRPSPIGSPSGSIN
jgi:hypothetical protein